MHPTTKNRLKPSSWWLRGGTTTPGLHPTSRGSSGIHQSVFHSNPCHTAQHGPITPDPNQPQKSSCQVAGWPPSSLWSASTCVPCFAASWPPLVAPRQLLVVSIPGMEDMACLRPVNSMGIYSVAWGKGPTKNLMTLVCCHLINTSKQVVYPCPSHRNVWPQLSDSRSPTQQQLQPLIWKTFRTRKSCKGLKWTRQCTWNAVSEEPIKHVSWLQWCQSGCLLGLTSTTSLLLEIEGSPKDPQVGWSLGVSQKCWSPISWSSSEGSDQPSHPCPASLKPWQGSSMLEPSRVHEGWSICTWYSYKNIESYSLPGGLWQNQTKSARFLSK